MQTAVIGGGLCGLSAAIRLAQRGLEVELFEAAPSFGGRTRSFLEPHMQQWVDNGPHLLSGAYHDTLSLLQEAGASDNIAWQQSLCLPLWDKERGHFLLKPNASLPLALTLPLACARLPGHDWTDIPAFLRMALQMQRPPPAAETVQTWLNRTNIPASLCTDLLEPLCLGAMNEPLAEANAASFSAVLHSAFANHASARLGWFHMPLNQALIEPLVHMAEALGVRMHRKSRIRRILPCREGIELELAQGRQRFKAGVLATPLRSAQQILSLPTTATMRRITNIHMWFRDLPALPQPFIGGIGTSGQWFFDVSKQMHGSVSEGNIANSLRHICAVISADDGKLHGDDLVQKICVELGKLGANATPPEPHHVRIISEHHATTSVAHSEPADRLEAELPKGLIDACEAPYSGELPSTIEYAVRRGNQAAEHCSLHLTS